MVEPGFDLVQFIKDFQLIAVLVILAGGIVARYELLGKLAGVNENIHTEIASLREEISSLKERQKEHYDRLWGEQRDQSSRISKQGERIAKLEAKNE